MKPPLALYILWHPEFDAGARYADNIYSNFTRDIQQPLSRGIGIPVYFRSVPFEEGVPLAINLEAYDHSVVIPLVSSHIIAYPSWTQYLDALYKQIHAHGNHHLMLPVSITDLAFNLPRIGALNFIRLHAVENKKQIRFLIEGITHALCRLLYGRERPGQSPSPLKLFISHAKADGKKLAEQMRDYIASHTNLATFFDANDIADGYQFSSEIEANIKQSVLLVIHSDKYASREWCRREILVAKQYQRPVVIVNVFHEGEDRSFPYMANVRNLRCAPNEPDGKFDTTMIQRILTDTLYESLRFKYNERYLEHLVDAFGVEINALAVLPAPPELLTLLPLRHLENKCIVYPDPPLGDEELEILREFDREMKFITPTLLPIFTN